MRGWEQLLDGYMAEYSARGVCDSRVARTASVLAHWGTWMRARRPRPRLEQIDADAETDRRLKRNKRSDGPNSWSQPLASLRFGWNPLRRTLETVGCCAADRGTDLLWRTDAKRATARYRMIRGTP